ncbi:MAG: hypothetical protein JJU36_13600 [Phycisphaeraceae bacterium]|nr:hypothetical protein [Phycisphaeraceae bacterium]
MMTSDGYNSEAALIAELEALRLEAREIEVRRQASTRNDERLMLDRQLREVMDKVGRIRKSLALRTPV